MIQTESMLQIFSYLQSFPCTLLEVLIVEFNQSFAPFSSEFCQRASRIHCQRPTVCIVIQQNRARAQSSLTILIKVFDKSYYGNTTIACPLAVNVTAAPTRHSSIFSDNKQGTIFVSKITSVCNKPCVQVNVGLV